MDKRDDPLREGAKKSSSGVELSLDAARARLRERGYLDRGVEGAVLKGALAARTRTRAFLLGAATGAAFLAAAVAFAQTVLVAVSSALPLRDAAVLFLWLFAGAAAVASLVVLALVLLALVRARAHGDAEEGSMEIAVAFGVLVGVASVLAARPALESAGMPAAAAVLLAVAFAVLIAVRVARGLAFTVLAASGRLFVTRPRRTFVAWALAGGTLVLVGISALFFRVPAVGDSPLVVAANARRVVVVGVDGWTEGLPGEGAARALREGGARPGRLLDDGRDRRKREAPRDRLPRPRARFGREVARTPSRRRRLVPEGRAAGSAPGAARVRHGRREARAFVVGGREPRRDSVSHGELVDDLPGRRRRRNDPRKSPFLRRARGRGARGRRLARRRHRARR